MRVQVVMAWPGRSQLRDLDLPPGAQVADAVAAAADLDPGRAAVAYAVHGLLARPQQPLCEGDRVELLRPLQVDPKDARRRRAAAP